MAKQKQEIKRNWHLIDVDGLYVGRVATRIATILMGKNKPTFVPHIDAGDYVVALNTDKIKISGNKTDQKMYFHFSGYPGGLSRTPYKEAFKKDSRWVLKTAVWGMMAKNKLRNQTIKRLKLFKNDKHPYADKFTPTPNEHRAKGA
jgi:large subunit ribosomal protein L13